MKLKERVKLAFKSDLGRQINSLFSTSDGELFIRAQEAINHSIENSLNREDIKEWYEEYSGKNPEPNIIYFEPFK
jgi:hypothetical protein